MRTTYARCTRAPPPSPSPPRPPRRTPRSRSASPAGPASRRSRSRRKPASSRRTASTSTIKKIPQKDRHLAIASGDVQCAATTVETWIVWNANGVPTTQIFQLDKSYGADGMAVRNNIAKIADLKGKTVAASRARHRALLHARVVPQEERPVGEGRDRRQPRAGPGRAGVRRRAERRGDDLRAVPVDRARRAAGRQDHRDHARLSDDDGHVRLHAEVPRRQSRRPRRRWPTATSRRSR